jgi:hypothetical protein
MSRNCDNRTRRWRRLASRIFAVSLVTICAGCASLRQPAPEPLARILPTFPEALAASDAGPSVAVNDDARAKLAQTRDALKLCRAQNGNARAWYDGVRRSYGGEAAK